MSDHLNYSGFVIAVLAFFLTRFTVALALYGDPVQFYLAGVVPLAAGLGLAAFGVALVVADVRRSLVRTTALWCLVGFGTMLVLVVLTLLGSSTDSTVDPAIIQSQTSLSNFLIAGSIGGTLIGLYAARNRRQRTELRRQTNQIVTLNRLLRHEVLNAVTAIRGYASVDPDENPKSLTIIDERAVHIEQTIEDVNYLTEDTGTEGSSRSPQDLGDALDESVGELSDRHPDVTVSVGSVPADLTVYGNEQLPLVFTHLLENAVLHGEDDAPAVEVDSTQTTVSVSVTDEGPGLPENQRALLETGDIEEFDNPRVGFGLNIVRLLVTSYGGRIDTEVSGRGTTVTVVLPRATTSSTDHVPNRVELSGVRPAVPHLVVTCVAAVIAGIPYGIVSKLLGGSVAGIGVFYGTVDPVVGWLTHEFHSVVFALMYVGILSLVLDRYRNATSIYVGVGVVWSVVVWTVAASFVAPVWLQLVGIPAPVPNFSARLLMSHLAWGLSLGLLTSLGYKYGAPRLSELGQRLRGVFVGR